MDNFIMTDFGPLRVEDPDPEETIELMVEGDNIWKICNGTKPSREFLMALVQHVWDRYNPQIDEEFSAEDADQTLEETARDPTGGESSATGETG